MKEEERIEQEEERNKKEEEERKKREKEEEERKKREKEEERKRREKEEEERERREKEEEERNKKEEERKKREKEEERKKREKEEEERKSREKEEVFVKEEEEEEETDEGEGKSDGWSGAVNTLKAGITELGIINITEFADEEEEESENRVNFYSDEGKEDEGKEDEGMRNVKNSSVKPGGEGVGIKAAPQMRKLMGRSPFSNQTPQQGEGEGKKTNKITTIDSGTSGALGRHSFIHPEDIQRVLSKHNQQNNQDNNEENDGKGKERGKKEGRDEGRYEEEEESESEAGGMLRRGVAELSEMEGLAEKGRKKSGVGSGGGGGGESGGGEEQVHPFLNPLMHPLVSNQEASLSFIVKNKRRGVDNEYSALSSFPTVVEQVEKLKQLKYIEHSDRTPLPPSVSLSKQNLETMDEPLKSARNRKTLNQKEDSLLPLQQPQKQVLSPNAQYGQSREGREEEGGENSTEEFVKEEREREREEERKKKASLLFERQNKLDFGGEEELGEEIAASRSRREEKRREREEERERRERREKRGEDSVSESESREVRRRKERREEKKYREYVDLRVFVRFLKAASEGDVPKLRKLLKINRNLLRAEDDNGWTALEHCIARGTPECAIWLVRKGAKVNPKSRSGGALPLQVAVHPLLNTLEFVKLLLGLGAKVDLKDKQGATALWEAVRTANYKAVKLLVKMGADIHLTAKENGIECTLYQRAKYAAKIHPKQGSQVLSFLKKLMTQPQKETRFYDL